MRTTPDAAHDSTTIQPPFALQLQQQCHQPCEPFSSIIHHTVTHSSSFASNQSLVSVRPTADAWQQDVSFDSRLPNCHSCRYAVYVILIYFAGHTCCKADSHSSSYSANIFEIPHTSTVLISKSKHILSTLAAIHIFDSCVTSSTLSAGGIADASRLVCAFSAGYTCCKADLHSSSDSANSIESSHECSATRRFSDRV